MHNALILSNPVSSRKISISGLYTDISAAYMAIIPLPGYDLHILSGKSLGQKESANTRFIHLNHQPPGLDQDFSLGTAKPVEECNTKPYLSTSVANWTCRRISLLHFQQQRTNLQFFWQYYRQVNVKVGRDFSKGQPRSLPLIDYAPSQILRIGARSL